MATASELFECRHFASAVATCSSALEASSHTVAFRLLRARCFIALRRTAEAQKDLGDVIRLDPQCGIAYRLLGELAALRDEHESAAIFFREALRLDAGDREARDWLVVVDGATVPRTNRTWRPSTAGGFPRTPAPLDTPRTASGARTLSSPARLARGTQAPDEDLVRPARPVARGSARNGHLFTPGPELVERIATSVADRVRASHTVAISDLPSLAPRRAPGPAAVQPALAAPRPSSRPYVRQQTPELPGFGEYLVSTGILTRERLRAAQAYQRSMKVQLATAIVTLGLASPQRIEYASVSHRSVAGSQAAE